MLDYVPELRRGNAGFGKPSDSRPAEIMDMESDKPRHLERFHPLGTRIPPVTLPHRKDILRLRRRDLLESSEDFENAVPRC